MALVACTLAPSPYARLAACFPKILVESDHLLFPRAAPRIRVAAKRMNQSISNSQRVQQAKMKRIETLRSLLDEDRYPIGSYTGQEYKLAKRHLGFLREIRCLDAETVNLAFDVIERIIQETAKSDLEDLRWISTPRNTFLHFQNWKKAALLKKKVDSPEALLRRLQAVPTEFSQYLYNTYTVGLIVDVILSKKTTPEEAVTAADDMLKFCLEEAAKTNNKALQPTWFTYNQVLETWAASPRDDTASRMETYVETMRLNPKTAPNAQTYNILLGYYKERRDLAKVDEIMRTMRHEKVVPSLFNLSIATECYAEHDEISKAKDLLFEMMEPRPKVRKGAAMVNARIVDILKAYRRRLSSPGLSADEKAHARQSQKEFIEQIMAENAYIDKALFQELQRPQQ